MYMRKMIIYQPEEQKMCTGRQFLDRYRQDGVFFPIMLRVMKRRYPSPPQNGKHSKCSGNDKRESRGVGTG